MEVLGVEGLMGGVVPGGGPDGRGGAGGGPDGRAASLAAAHMPTHAAAEQQDSGQ